MRAFAIFTLLSMFFTSSIFGASATPEHNPAHGGASHGSTVLPRAWVVAGAVRPLEDAPVHGGAGGNISSTISRALGHLDDDLEERVDDALDWVSNIFARMSLRPDGYTAVASEPPAPVLSPIGSFTEVASAPPAPVLLAARRVVVEIDIVDPKQLAKDHLAWEIGAFLVEGLLPPTHEALMELPSALAYASYERNIVRALLPLAYEPTFSDMDNLGIIMTAARFARHHSTDTFIKMFDDRAKFNFPQYRRKFERYLRLVGIVPENHIAYNNGAFYLSRPFPRLGGERFEWITATYKEHLQKFCPDIPKPATGAVTSYTCACGKHNS